MKKFIFTLTVLLFFRGIALPQTTPSFNLTKDGVKPVVLNFEASLKADQIYTKIKDWIVITYKYPKAVTRIDQENALLKVGSIKEKAWKVRANDFDHWYDLEYTLTIEIKDGRCRVTFDTADVRWKVWFNKDGSTIKKFKDSEVTFEKSINDLLSSLYNHIKGPKVKKDDW